MLHLPRFTAQKSRKCKKCLARNEYGPHKKYKRVADRVGRVDVIVKECPLWRNFRLYPGAIGKVLRWQDIVH